MPTWVYVVLFVGALLAIAAVVDWRRRGSMRGLESRAERSGQGAEAHIVHRDTWSGSGGGGYGGP